MHVQAQDNQQIIRRFLSSVIEAHDPGSADDVLAPNYTVHMVGMPEPVTGRDAWKALIASYFAAFPDLSIEIQDEVAAGDRIAMRLVWSGTHRADFMGIPATGRKVRVQTSAFFRVADGRVHTEWHQDDVLGHLQQLGAAAAPATAIGALG
jgi:steroid delta-isomerase-like uncharacterized protein